MLAMSNTHFTHWRFYMRPLICSVAIISLSIASTCIANTDDNNVIHLNIVSADHPYTLTMNSYQTNCKLTDGKQLPQTLSLQTGLANAIVWNIALKPNQHCSIEYNNNNRIGTYSNIDISTFNSISNNRIHYRDGQTSRDGLDDGVTIWNTLGPSIAYSNGQTSR